MNNNIINKDSIKRITDKIKTILSNKKTILGTVIFISIILLIAIAITISIILKKNNYTVDTLKEYNWNDFIIFIDGHKISYKTSMAELEEMGFILQDKTYNINIDANYDTGGVLYSYKNEEEKYNTIFFAAYNDSDKSLFFKDCKLSGIDFNQNFYQSHKVVLPRGLLLDNKLTIDKIINQWGKPSQTDLNTYQWTQEEHMIKIYTNDDKTVLNVIYD